MRGVAQSMTVRKSYISTSRGDLHLRECGTGEPLVLLQSLTRSAAMYEPVLPLFAQAGYRAIAIDPMGYGRSDMRKDVWLVEDFAANLIEAFKALEIAPRKIVAGHFTAMIAAQIALDQEQALDGLVFDGVPVWPDAVREQMQSALPAEEPVMDENGEGVGASWSRAWQHTQRLDPDAKLSRETENAFIEIFIETLAIARKPGPTTAFFSYSLIDKLPLLEMPVLLLRSQTDTLEGRHDEAMRLVPNCKAHDFQGIHPLYRLVPGDDLGAYVDAVAGFFAGLERNS